MSASITVTRFGILKSNLIVMFGNLFLRVRHKLGHVVLAVESVLVLVLVRALELLVLTTVPEMFVIKMFGLFLRPFFVNNFRGPFNFDLDSGRTFVLD